MEDCDAEGTETEPLVNKSKRSPPPPPSFLSSPPTLHKPRASTNAPLKSNTSYNKFPPKPSAKVPTQGRVGFSSSSTWKAPIDVSPSLNALHEANEEPALEEVHLPERKGREGHVPVPHGTNREGSYILCPFFGVRNYLHDFYEKPKGSGNIVPTREDIFMVKRREGPCSSSIFRLSLLLGGIVLLMGATAFIVAVCASRRATLIGKIGGVPVEDRVAAVHNAEVDALLLVGLIAVTLGATVVASALISQAFCTAPNYEETFRENLWSARPTSVYTEYPHWIYTMESRVPATEELTKIQPCAAHQAGLVNPYRPWPK